MQPSWKKIYVFVSSTFTDLHGERDFLVKRVFPRLSDWCERRRLRLVDVDLRWGVTEQDATRNRNVVAVCLRRIDECRPFFMCFLGQRYGWVPSPGDVSSEAVETFRGLGRAVTEGVSITELEILHAVVGPFPSAAPAQALACDAAFFFLREDSSLANLPGDPACLRRFYTDEAETDTARREFLLGRLRRLKNQMVRDSHRPVIPYEARWDAAAATPELELPLECPSDFEATAQRWRDQWREFAGIEIAPSAVAVPDADRARAMAFNQRLTRGRLVEFTCEGGRLEERICEELQRAIEARHPDHVERGPGDALHVELDQHEQFLFDCSQEFIARGNDFADLDDYAFGHGPEIFVLTAGAGAGKSTLLAAWLERCRALHGSVEGLTVHFRFLGASHGSSTVFSLLHSLASELKQARKCDDSVPADPVRLRLRFPGLLAEAGRKGPTILVLDGLNQLDSGLRDLDWLPRRLPDGVRVIVSLRADAAGAPELLQRWRESGRMLVREVVPFASPDHRRMLVKAHLAQHLKQLDDRHLEALIANAGAQNPLYLKVVLSELRVFGGHAGLGERIRRAFGHTPESAFDSMLQRLETEAGYTPIASGVAAPHLMGLLAHARNGLSVEELGDLLSAAAGGQTTLDQGREAALYYLRQMRQFLARRQGRYDFFYESLRNAALSRSERRLDPAEWHRLLARHFRAAAFDRGSWKASARRALSELAYHLLRSGELESLYALYSDMAYVDARCRPLPGDDGGAARDGSGFLEFLNELYQALPVFSHHDQQKGESLAALVRLLAERNAMLSRYPESTVQEIGNYLDRYSESDAAGAIAAAARAMPAPLMLSRISVPRSSHGRGAKITALASAPSGGEFLSGAEDGTVGYWNLSEARPRWVVPAHEEHVTSIAFSADGARALTAGNDGGILLWDLAVGAHRLFRPLGPHAACAWIGGFLDAETAVAATAGTVFTLDLAGGALLWWATPDSTVLSLAPDLRAVVSAQQGGDGPYAIRLLRVGESAAVPIAALARPAAQLLFTETAILAADSQAYLFAFSSQGSPLAELSLGGPLSSWCRMADGTVAAGDLLGGIHRISPPPAMTLQSLPPEASHHRAATALAPLRQSRMLAGREDGSIELLEPGAGLAVRSWEPAMNLAAGALVDDRNAAGVVGSHAQGEGVLGRGPYFISADARITQPAVEPHSRLVTGLAALEKALVLTVDRGGTAVLWRGGRPDRVHRCGLDLTCCGVWPEGGVGVAGSSGDAVYLVGRGPEVREIALPKRYDAPGVSAVAAGGRPMQIIAALNNSEVASAGYREWRVKSRSGMGTAAAIDASARLAATGHAFGKIHLWNADTGEEIWQIALHIGPVYALAFGCGGLLYSTGADHCLLAVDPHGEGVVAATELTGAGLALRPGTGGAVSALDSSGTLYLFAPGGPAKQAGRTPDAGWFRRFRKRFTKEVP